MLGSDANDFIKEVCKHRLLAANTFHTGLQKQEHMFENEYLFVYKCIKCLNAVSVLSKAEFASCGEVSALQWSVFPK